jgi:hypothetical protein
MIVNELQWMQKEVVIAYFKVIELSSPWTEENHENHESV